MQADSKGFDRVETCTDHTDPDPVDGEDPSNRLYITAKHRRTCSGEGQHG